MNIANTDRHIAETVRKVLSDEVEKIVSEEAAAAAVRTEKRVKEKTAQIASSVLTRFNMEMVGSRLIISVDIKS